MARNTILLTLILTACDGASQSQTSPRPIVTSAVSAVAAPISSDARAVKSLRDQLGNLETTYDAAMSAVLDTFNKVALGQVDDSNRDALNDAAKNGMRMGTAILAQSLQLQAPTVTDSVLQNYVNQIVSAHKAWARALQSRDAAFSRGNIDRAIHFKDAADGASSREAANLALAYRQVGLPIQ